MAAEVESPSVFNITTTISESRLQLLQELLNVTSHDIGKLDVSEIVLRYFERQRKRERIIAGNPWKQDDPAIRHLQISAQGSCRQVYLTRGRLGAGGDREITAAALVAKAREKREKREKRLRELAAKDAAATAEKEKVTTPATKKSETPTAPSAALGAGGRELSAVAETLVTGALDRAQIEREVSEIATQAVWSSLNTAYVENELQTYVAELISTAIERAKLSLESELEVDADTQRRIESIAQEMVREAITRAESAYMREQIE